MPDGHIPVMLSEAMEALSVKKGGRYIDGTSIINCSEFAPMIIAALVSAGSKSARLRNFSRRVSISALGSRSRHFPFRSRIT